MLTLVDKTPYEAWGSKNPSLSHIRVFRCDAFVHISKERRKKLDNKSEKCIFIVYKDGINGYKLWNPTTRTTIYNKDAIFKKDESTSWNEKVKREREQENLEFDLRNERHALHGLIESKEEVEVKTLVVWRYG